jgi:hypothetical protein
VRLRWSLQLVLFLGVVAPLAFGQGGNGTITGTVTDPSGLVIAGATVEATNTETGVVYSGASTGAGNYAIPNMPVGSYALTVKVPGFKTYTHANLALAATQILREDIPLQVGTASETVTVEAQASLLKTETGDNSSNVTLEEMQDLPLLGIGTVNSGSTGVRNPYNVLLTLPGVSGYNLNSGGLFYVNGLGGGFVLSETMRVEGQDATSRMFNAYTYTQMAQPNADAIQEVAYQTSNYAPEFGQAGSVVVNMTMKSGTNRYHGTGFEYFVNEDLNSGMPFSISGGAAGGDGSKLRPRNRRNDFGGTLGGPISIPKIYNGKDRSFFFFAYEQYQETNLYTFTDTVPTTDYVNGNFGHISPNGDCSLCSLYGIPKGPLGGVNAQGLPNYTDAMGRPTYANEVYDPTTRAVNPANGRAYADPFSNNVVPPSYFNSSSKLIQALFPAAQNSNLIGNYLGTVPGNRYSAIPSIKIDQIISPSDKVSFYWSRINTESQVSVPFGGADGLPLEIGQYRGTFIPTYTARLNYDRTLTPTLLLHVGAGYYHTSFSDRAAELNFDPTKFGLSGFLIHRNFPVITGMCPAPPIFGASLGCTGYGGMQQLGPGAGQSQNYEEKPSFNANATWVKGSHAFKLGGEMYLEQNYTGNISLVTLATGTGPTSLPENPTVGFGGFTEGFGYASFLLGDFTSTTQAPNRIYRVGNQTWGLFLQDSWKVTRRLTLDYGLRWDYNTPYHEQYGRLGQFDPTKPNANAGGRLGATRYASTCNCPFYQAAYPYAIGPRLGVAYQINPKTVFRGGFGINYQYVGANAGSVIGTNGVYPLTGVNPFVNISTPGSIVQPTWPVTDPNIFPVPNTVGGTPMGFAPDANQNRTPRIMQWSVGFQREITPNLVVEASYVGNHSAWLSGPLGFLSQISPATFAQYGLYPYPGTGPAGYNYKPAGINCAPGNDCDRALLSQPLSSVAVQQKLSSAGLANFTPYSGFPANNTLLSSLYSYPQFGNLAVSGSATGNSKYDALQIKVNKRFSHGLQANANFTWAQGFTRPTRQDFFNPNGAVWQLQQIPPVDLNFNIVYTVPKFAFLPKVANTVVKEWQFGWFSNYQSGQFLAPPVSTTANYLPSEDIRVPGQALYTKGVNLNNHSTFDPYSTQVLNPAAWTQCPVNAACASAAPPVFGTTPTATAYYKDFRAPRTPTENANIGRNFRFGKDGRYNLFIRGEFVNIFNRTIMPAPSTSNPQNPVARNGQGILTGGFGVINAYFTPGSANATSNAPFLQGRTGTIIARFSF